MRTSSCKAKARRLQQLVASKIIEAFSLPTADVRSTSMGCPGEDIWLSDVARSRFGFSVECKMVEKLNVWAAFEQAKSNAGEHVPLLVHSRNRSDVLATIRFDDLLKILKDSLPTKSP